MSITVLQNQISAAESECGALSTKLQAEFTKDMDHAFCEDLRDRIADVLTDVEDLVSQAEDLAEELGAGHTYDRLQEMQGALEDAVVDLEGCQENANVSKKSGMTQALVDYLVSALDRTCDLLTEASNA